jgi:MoaA/NifB/PqqE/SkfB family radical SAM enzyme
VQQEITIAGGHKKARSKKVTGFHFELIKRFMWVTIFAVALRIFKNPLTAFRKMIALKRLRGQYHNKNLLRKYTKSGRRYFVNLSIPGWPSAAFNRFAAHQLRRFAYGGTGSIHTLVFAITKKCGFQCEHCCEWLNLNKPETLSREEVVLVIHRFHRLGIAQLQLSGGEPLNRLQDIYYLLDHLPRGIDCWLYTTGYSLTAEKAKLLKKHGLTGITISLDHCDREKHNRFRGVKNAYEKALLAAACARDAGLLTCFSLCATREFISTQNLLDYATLAREYGVSFIQILEPKAVGHYAGEDVLLKREQQLLLEEFFETFNYNPAYESYPTIVYHDYNKRRFGCVGAGADYVYADTDGDIHNCPFCQQKLFSAFDDELPELLQQMKAKGCRSISFCSKK